MEEKIIVGVVDGQGGGIGSLIVERLKAECPQISIIALGTNGFATNKMLKSGAHQGASGENALIFNIKKVDVIMGVVAILMPNSMMGELSPKMAEAIGTSSALKVLIPLDKCNINIVGTADYSIQEYVNQSIIELKNKIEK